MTTPRSSVQQCLEEFNELVRQFLDAVHDSSAPQSQKSPENIVTAMKKLLEADERLQASVTTCMRR